MSDLAEQILTAVQADEDEAKRALSAPVGQTEHGIAHCAGHLRRCAADRELVALHAMDDLGRLTCQVCSEVQFSEDRAMDWPCPTLRAVARGYGIQP